MVVCLLASGAVAASPVLLSGPYQVGEMGVLTFKVSKEELKGFFLSGTRCDFAPSEQLVSATIDGSAVVGTLTTCLEGRGCSTAGGVPFLGVISDTGITTYLSFPQGCGAPGLDQKAVVTMQIDFGFLKKSGEEAMAAQKWDAAIPFLRRAAQLPQGATDLNVLNLLGSAYNLSKQYAEGRKVFEGALEVVNRKGAPGELRATLLYNLACAVAGAAPRDPMALTQAVEHLKQAVLFGPRPQFSEALAKDADLDPLRGLPEFQKLKKAYR